MPRRPATARRTAGVIRLVDAQGSSKRGWAAAVADAVREARAEAPEPLAVEVVRQWADLDRAGRIATYHVAVRLVDRQRIVGPR